MLQFELTGDDYVAASFLNARWTWARWLRSLALLTALIGFGLWRMPHDPQRVLMIIAGYVVILVVVIGGYHFIYMPWRARNVFAQTKALQRAFTWAWDEEQLRYKTDLATGIVPWTNLSSWRENEALFALYASPIAFFLFPKRAFPNEAAVETFRATLRKHVMAVPPPAAVF